MSSGIMTKLCTVQVASASSLQAEEEDLLSDAPEEFLCPIMSILMLDPVVLPSSRKVVDRFVN